MCNPDTQEQKVWSLALVGLSIYEEGPDATKVQNSRSIEMDWQRAEGKPRTTPSVKTEALGKELVSMELKAGMFGQP